MFPLHIPYTPAPRSKLGILLYAAGVLVVVLFCQVGLFFLFGMGLLDVAHPIDLSKAEQRKAVMAVVIGAFGLTVFPVIVWRFLVVEPIKFMWNFRKHENDQT